VPIHAREHPTACCSFNYHRDLFGRAWKIETADGTPAHSACVGFGVERITLALFKHHGFAVDQWPGKVRGVLGL
jgi:seryl-tRNA synthetase